MLKKEKADTKTKYIKKFEKKYRGGLFLFIGMLLLQSVSFYLCGVLKNDAYYFLAVEVVVLIAAGIYAFIRYEMHRKHLALQIEHYLLEMGALPDTEDPVEELYIETLEQIRNEQKEEENQYFRKLQEMQEYYALWVHQIKTPISAMKLLLQMHKKELWKSDIREENVFQTNENRSSDYQLIGDYYRNVEENRKQESDFYRKVEENKKRESDFYRKVEENKKRENDFLQEAEQEVFWIEEYVNMALQYQRMMAETNDFVLEKVNLDEVIRAAIRKFAKLMIRRKISIQYDGCSEYVISDKKWLGFVVEQILSNAIKYSRENSSICISVEASSRVKGKMVNEITGNCWKIKSDGDAGNRQEEKSDGGAERYHKKNENKDSIVKRGEGLNENQIENVCTRNKKQGICDQAEKDCTRSEQQGLRDQMEKNCLLIIKDQGIGIRKEDLPRIFEKGYTGYNGRADKTSTGIGLYLCRKMTKKLGHSLKITSEVGTGTSVMLRFSEKQIKE